MEEEYLDLVDENNNVIGKAPRSEVRRKNLPHRGTCIFIFNSKGEILITKRTVTKDVYPDLLEIGQGGAVSYGEEYEYSAKREVGEEVGISNPKLEYLFDFHWQDEYNNSFWKVYKCIYDGDIKMQPEEVEDFFFISVDKLNDMIENRPEKFTPDGIAVFGKYLEVYCD